MLSVGFLGAVEQAENIKMNKVKRMGLFTCVMYKNNSNFAMRNVLVTHTLWD